MNESFHWGNDELLGKNGAIYQTFAFTYLIQDPLFEQVYSIFTYLLTCLSISRAKIS